MHARQSNPEQAACVNQSAQAFLESMQLNAETDGRQAVYAIVSVAEPVAVGSSF